MWDKFVNITNSGSKKRWIIVLLGPYRWVSARCNSSVLAMESCLSLHWLSLHWRNDININPEFEGVLPKGPYLLGFFGWASYVIAGYASIFENGLLGLASRVLFTGMMKIRNFNFWEIWLDWINMCEIHDHSSDWDISGIVIWPVMSGLILDLCWANERYHYKVMPSLIGWSQTYNQPYM